LAGTWVDPDYVEAPGFQAILNALVSTNDAKLDGVHAQRTATSANLVVLLVGNATSCGMAKLSAVASTAFSVVNGGCATGSYSFAHEIGHNLGAKHAREDYATPTADDNYGYKNVAGKFRTIMAYDPGKRVNYWSTPDLFYNGMPLGIAGQSNNVRVLNANRLKAAQWR